MLGRAWVRGETDDEVRKDVFGLHVDTQRHEDEGEPDYVGHVAWMAIWLAGWDEGTESFSFLSSSCDPSHGRGRGKRAIHK